MQHIVVTLLLAIIATVLVNAQTGPFPPRLNIPGALPVSTRPQFRIEKPARVRRPIALRSQNNIVPSVTPRITEDPKPVTETEEDELPDVFLPQLLREQQLAQAQQAQFQQAAAAFLNNDQNSIQETPANHFLPSEETAPTITTAPTRFPERVLQQAQPAPSARPAFNDFGIGSSAQRFALERPQPNTVSAQTPQRIQVVRTRPPIIREQRPNFDLQAAPAPTPVLIRQRPKPIQSRPIIDQNQLPEDRDPNLRRQRPVAQTLRKWREENEDGSITWGYENDDGSFKEEVIGTDCITKGTYGYVDPDGNKREYHYETGIKCDPNTRETEEDLQQNGFINYEENKAILPNGFEIDMSQLGKKKSNRPGSNYRN